MVRQNISRRPEQLVTRLGRSANFASMARSIQPPFREIPRCVDVPAILGMVSRAATTYSFLVRRTHQRSADNWQHHRKQLIQRERSRGCNILIPSSDALCRHYRSHLTALICLADEPHYFWDASLCWPALQRRIICYIRTVRNADHEGSQALAKTVAMFIGARALGAWTNTDNKHSQDTLS